jgi:hypothetical protein
MTCAKRRYGSRAKAEKDRIRITNNVRRLGMARIPRRSYECPDCGGWHLTSMERAL